MRRNHVALLFLLPIVLFCTGVVSADPRMETNSNFCHFILDPINTDNEIFAAGCDSQITTIEGAVAAADIQVTCENVLASGYGEATKIIPEGAISVLPGQTLRYTSNDSDTPCTMVESNGRAYISYNWTSVITVESTRPKGFVKVHYRLFCKDGQL